MSGMKGNEHNHPWKGIFFGAILTSLLFVWTSCAEQRGGETSVSKQVGDLRLTVAYEPALLGGKEESKNEVEYFKVRLEQVDDRDVVEHLSATSGLTREEVLYYLSYRLKDDISLEQGEKQQSSVLYHFERSFDLKSGRVFNVGFEPADRSDGAVTLLIASDLLNTGPIKFKF